MPVPADQLARVRRAFDLGALQRRCQQSKSRIFRDFVDAGGELRGKPGELHAIRDRGAGVLAVAHLDTVQDSNHFYSLRMGGRPVVFSPKLDDRMGVYVILDLLPKLGIVVDVLLTENEEIGRSTAADFAPDRQYNWMVEFDRCGEDTVTYDYKWGNEIRDHFEQGHGTFSDICSLEHLGCKGFNVGVGYYDEHSLRAYAHIDEFLRQIARFLAFYDEYAGIAFVHEATARLVYSVWDDDDDIAPTIVWPRKKWWDEEDKDVPLNAIGWCEKCAVDVDCRDVWFQGTTTLCAECGEEVFMYCDFQEL